MKNFKYFYASKEIEANGKNLLIYGENGSGKSSIYWSLYTLLHSALKATPADVKKYFDPGKDENLRNKNIDDVNEDSYVEAPEASLLLLAKVANPIFNYKTWQLMRHFLPMRESMTRGGFDIPFDFSQVTREDSCYYEGYWQNEGNFKHIRNKILKAYTFPKFEDEMNNQLADRLKNTNAVSCHIRRGDYLKEPNMCVCTPEYYTNAIKKMNEITNPVLYVIFSDDIQWCKENIRNQVGNREVVFVDWNKGEQSFRDIQLMTLCKHNIIANSSFSWWGAWLNQNEGKVVVAPEKFTNGNPVNDPICEDWVKVKS